jgi:AAA+ superfamily predicted ATPase
MLTDDLTDFSNDFVEGKAAGNLIICKGPPGVGKTLTGELYSEHKKVPLIVLRAGKLGTTVAEVTKGMKQYLEWATRWNCPILVNECDIYIAKRSDNINLNAIVAEMLQLVEYYPGLLFMTTNRPDDIDDAFVSRALAIINYAAPEGNLVDESWRQIASLHDLKMDETMIMSLKQQFPSIVQRDMKMLLKLAMKRSKRSREPITPDLLRKMAMFRDIKMSAIELGTPDNQ